MHRRRTESLRAAAFVLVACAAAWATALPNGFTYDDHELIGNEPRIRDGRDLGSLVAEPIFAGSRGGTLGFWRPLPVASFWLDYRWTGGAAAGFHFVNVLIHFGNALLVWLVGRRLAPGSSGSSALFAACLFAVHPVTGDAVASISGRMDLLAAAGALGALAAAPERPSLVFVLTLAACLSKEVGVVAPVVLIAGALGSRLDGGGRPWRRAWLASAAAVVLWLALRWAATGELMPSARIRWIENPLVREELPVRLSTAVALVGRYAGLLVAPFRLSASYEYDSIPLARSPLDPWTLGGIAALALLGWVVFHAIRRKVAGRVLPVAALLVLPLALVLPFPRVAVNLFAERYAYLPAAGFALLVAWIAGERLATWRVPARATAAGAVVIVGLLALRTAERNRDWRNDETLFRATVERFPGNVKALSNLAREIRAKGDSASALPLLEKAVAIAPDFTENVHNLGTLYADQGRLDEAAAAFRRRLAAAPDDALARTGLGNVLLRRRRPDEALDQFLAALEVEPDHGPAALGASIAFRARGEFGAARTWAIRARDAGQPLPPGYLDSLP